MCDLPIYYHTDISICVYVAQYAQIWKNFSFMEVIVQKMIPGIIYFTESLLFQSTDVKNVTITEVTDK